VTHFGLASPVAVFLLPPHPSSHAHADELSDSKSLADRDRAKMSSITFLCSKSGHNTNNNSINSSNNDVPKGAKANSAFAAASAGLLTIANHQQQQLLQQPHQQQQQQQQQHHQQSKVKAIAAKTNGHM